MPEATPFTALGNGNGFPFCPEKIDVSSYDRWVTLGGTQKGSSPTDEEIQLSLKIAMAFFWNLYKIPAAAVAEADASPAGTAIAEVTEAEISAFVSGGNVTEPEERVCSDATEGYASEVDTVNYGGSLLVRATATSQFYCEIVRMYDGSTGDESNFVGYGVGSYLSIDPRNGAFADIIKGFLSVEAICEDLEGYFTGDTFNIVVFSSYLDELDTGVDYAYNSHPVGGTSFHYIEASAGGNGTTSWTASTNIEGFELYTYP